MDEVDKVRDDLREQKDLGTAATCAHANVWICLIVLTRRIAADELDNALSTPMGDNLIDDDELEAELQALEDEDIDAKLAGLDNVPAAPTKGLCYSFWFLSHARVVDAVALQWRRPKWMRQRRRRLRRTQNWPLLSE